MGRLIPGINDLQTNFPELTKEWDFEKNELAPSEVSAHSSKKFWWKCDSGHSWQASTASRTSGNGCPYCSGKLPVPGENDLATMFPELIVEWDCDKNAPKTPETVLGFSTLQFWWICFNGHSWQDSPRHRAKGFGCPVCAGKQVLKGFNDLATVNPGLVSEWLYQKNGNASPEQFNASSPEKVWWKCNSCGNEWQAVIADRAIRGKGCPECKCQEAFQTGSISENRLFIEYPELMSEWNFEKNKDIDVFKITSHSSKKVWWKCSKGHEWQAIVFSRSNGKRCPYCAGNYVIPGETDLSSKRPDVLKMWNYSKNGELKPEQLKEHSNKKVWWVCEKGHEWQAPVYSVTKGNLCPQCSKKKALAGINDLETLHPDLAAEWDYEKNDSIPSAFKEHSNKKVWWKCSQCGHEWYAMINSRTRGSGCPTCAIEKRKKKFPLH